jgi:hypothetical protein
MINICYTNILSKILQIIKKRIGFSFINTKDQIPTHFFIVYFNALMINVHTIFFPEVFFRCAMSCVVQWCAMHNADIYFHNKFQSIDSKCYHMNL